MGPFVKLQSHIRSAILDDVIESGRAYILKRSAVLCGMSFITFNRDIEKGTQRNPPNQKDHRDAIRPSCCYVARRHLG